MKYEGDPHLRVKPMEIFCKCLYDALYVDRQPHSKGFEEGNSLKTISSALVCIPLGNLTSSLRKRFVYSTFHMLF